MSSLSSPALPARPPYLLPTIVLAQFAGTSLWFAGNAIMSDLQVAFSLPEGSLGPITASVQLGFITGTLVFALLMVADRFSPSKVFFASALLASLGNVGVATVADGYLGVLLLRFLTGFFLAGIYPVGMKISADWYAKGLGRALGYLVGALVLGTAFPHFIRFQGGNLPWTTVLWITSGVATLGGLAIWLLVPDGPHRRRGSGFRPGVIAEMFRYPKFRAAAFGYFGHMWELYAFWAFVPVLLATYAAAHHELIDVSGWSFFIIGIGGLGCVLGGYASGKYGSDNVAFGMLLTSGLCCLLLPFVANLAWPLFATLLLLWGFTVVGDSPQFSTLVAQNAPPEFVGSALTLVNSIGFAITIGSIQLLQWAALAWSPTWMFWLLIPGPIFGLLALRQLTAKKPQTTNPEP
jgi:predicted MFS family arabinose efflux permease